MQNRKEIRCRPAHALAPYPTLLEATFVGSKTLMGTRSWIGHTIRKVNEKLCKATFCGGIITKYRGERRIPKRFRKALSEGFACASIVA